MSRKWLKLALLSISLSLFSCTSNENNPSVSSNETLKSEETSSVNESVSEETSSSEEKQQLDLAMQERFCASACYRNSNVLLLYAATIAEPETEWILSQALQDEKIVGLPKCLPERQMVFCQVTNS